MPRATASIQLPFELVITLHPEGNVTVTGRIDETFACYALLETAKDVVRQHSLDKAARLVEPATMGLPTSNFRS